MGGDQGSALEGAQFPASLRMLTPAQVMEIDRALEEIGPFGEVRLIKVKGRVRFIQKLQSQDLIRPNHPG